MSRLFSRRDFLKRAGISGAGLMLANRLPSLADGRLASTLRQATKTDLTIPSFWGPHEIAGAEAAFAEHFTPGTGINVKYEFIGSDYFPKLFTNLVSDTPYDVLTFNATDTPQFIDRGVLMPLDDLIARDNFDLSDFDPKAIEQWTYDGKLYGLTNDMGTFHCYFNLDLFEKAGIKAPAPTEEWTWDQLLEWSRALTIKEGDQVVQYGFAGANASWTEIWPNLNGALIWSDDFTTSLLDDPRSIEAFEFYQKLMWEEGTAVRPGSIQIGTNDLFLAGQLGILLGGTWQVGYFRSKKDEMKFNWDVGMPPHNAGAENYYILNFTAGWTLPTVAPDPDASWEAMKFYASQTFAEEVMFRALSSLPTRKSALESGGFDQWPDNPPPGLTPEFYAALLLHGKSRQQIGHVVSTDVTAALSNLDLIYSNERKPADLLPEVAAQVTAALASSA